MNPQIPPALYPAVRRLLLERARGRRGREARYQVVVKALAGRQT